MSLALKHRGPDDAGLWASEQVALGNRRLAVIGLDNGRQPLANEDASLWITYNGEIYNYRELRAELVAAGHRFRTETDAEVVLHLYEEHGIRSLKRLRGMFAFAIWDKRQRRLFAARDRFGQKPFFFSQKGRRLLFASEVKGVLAHPDVSVEPEPVAVDYYLALRFIPAPLTMVQGIQKLAAGHWLMWSDGKVRVEPYWRLDFEEGRRRNDEAWAAELAQRVDDVVGLHMVSDVPIGAFLSGGMDSSVVVASMARQAPGPIQTFSIGCAEPSFDESAFARKVSNALGTQHEERFVHASQLDRIPRLVRCIDEPSDPIAACMYEAARLASESVKVVLGGYGGDEVFGGFDRYAAYGWVAQYSALPRWLREGVVRPLVRRLPDSFAYKSFKQRAQWLDAVASEREARRYARMISFFRFGPEERAWTYGPLLRLMLRSPDAESAIAEPFQKAPADSILHRMLYTDSVMGLPEHTLLLADRLGMAHSLEIRSPLLDHELAEFCAALPPHLKVRRGKTKIAIRKIARSWLPPEIIRRPKQGFMFPVAYWLNRDTLPRIQNQLLHGRLVSQGWVRSSAIERLVAEHLRHRVDNHVRIWMLLNLEAWFRVYLYGEPVLDSLTTPPRQPGRARPMRVGA